MNPPNIPPRPSAAAARPAFAPRWASVGDAFDNAIRQSFFAALECELLAHRRFISQAEAGMAIFSYIEGWYNPTRRHSGIGNLSPIAYETQMLKETETT